MNCCKTVWKPWLVWLWWHNMVILLAIMHAAPKNLLKNACMTLDALIQQSIKVRECWQEIQVNFRVTSIVFLCCLCLMVATSLGDSMHCSYFDVSHTAQDWCSIWSESKLIIVLLNQKINQFNECIDYSQICTHSFLDRGNGYLRTC